MARVINDSLDLVGNQLLNVIAQNLSGDPGTNVADGRLYYSTSLNALRVRAGGAWTTLMQGAGFSAEDAADAVAAAIAAGAQTSGVTVTYDDNANSFVFSLDLLDYDAPGDIDLAATGTFDIRATTGVTIQTSSGGVSLVGDDDASLQAAAGNASVQASGSVNLISTGDNISFTDATHTVLTLGDVLDRANHHGSQASTTISDWAEAVQDVVGGMVAGNTETNITVTYDDTNGKLDFVAGSSYTTENAQDDIGTILVDSATVDFTYNDATPSITAAVLDSPLLQGQNSAYHLARANHTGSQLASTISDFTEAAQDVIGTMFSGNTETGITVTYNDAGNVTDFAVTDSPLLGGQNSAYHLARANHTGTQTVSTLSDFTTAVDERAQDVVGTIVGAGGNVVTYDDAGTGLTTITVTNNEAFQDVVGAVLNVGTGNTGIAVTYDDTNNRINHVVDAEWVQDQAGALLASGTRTGITATYDDANGELDLAVTDSPLLGGQNSAYHLARANHTGTQLFSTVTTTNTDKLLGRDTAAGGAVEEISVGGGVEFSGSQGIRMTMLTGDVTQAANGGATAIAAGVIVDADVNASAAIAATKLAFTPNQNSSNIAATNVQGAIEEAVTDLTALISATVEGRTWKDPVDASTTGALPAVTYGGTATLTGSANGALPAQDGVTMAVGDDLLVINQASSFQNGIYTVTDAGSAGTPFILTRRADSNSATRLRDATVIVEGGTTQGGDIYTQTSSTLANLTAAAQTWAKTGNTNVVYAAASGGGLEIVNGNEFRIATATAGAGLTGGGGSALDVSVGAGLEISGDAVRIAAAAAGSGLTGGAGSALDVNVGSGLEISSDAVRIAAAAAGNGLTGGAGSALAVGGGTGIAVTADAIAVDRATNGGKVALIFTAALSGGAATEDVTHNFGTNDVMVVVYNNTGVRADEEFSIERPTTNAVRVRSSVNIPGSTYRVVVMG